MALLQNIRNTSFIVNLLIILGLLIFLLQPLAWDFELPPAFWIRQSFMFFIWITLYFVVAKAFVPQLLFKNRLPLFFLTLFLSIVLSAVAVKLLAIFIHYNEAMQAARPFRRGGEGRARSGGFSLDTFVLVVSVLITGISSSIAIIRKWYEDNQSRLQLEQEKITTELSFLKAQINPHFFFNTLNNIYSLNRVDAEKAGDAIYTLSHMMRYVLYESKNNTSLRKEISFIDDYLKLMALRLTEKVKVNFEKQSGYLDHSIAPMLFLPYIENAFKHGISPVEDTSIYIGISSTKTTISIEVRNSIVLTKGEIMEESNGIGLINTKRRLDLLYPGKYILAINPHTDNNEYSVRLDLDVSDQNRISL